MSNLFPHHRHPPHPTGPSHSWLQPSRGLIVVLLLILCLWFNKNFLVPLAMGTIFSIVLSPLMVKMRGWKIGAYIKSLLVTILFALTFLLPIGAIITLVSDAALTKIQSLSEAGVNTNQISPAKAIELLGLQPWLEKLSQFSPMTENDLVRYASLALVTVGNWALEVVKNVVSSLPAVGFSMIIILLTIFFLLVDGGRAVVFLRANSVFDRRQTEAIIKSVVSLCYSVVVSSIIAGLAQAVLIAVSCFITHTSGAVLIALIAFVASFLPMVGTFPVTSFLTAQAFITGHTSAGFIFLVFLVLVIIADNVTRAYVLKGGAQLHPLVAFVSAFGAMDAIGFYGVFIGPVVAGVFFAVLPMVTRSPGRRWREKSPSP